MNRDIKIGVVGGDMRQLVMANELALLGFEVAVYAVSKNVDQYTALTRSATLEDCVRKAETVILGVPFSTDGIYINCPKCDSAVKIETLFDNLTPGQLLLGGKFNDYANNLAEKHGVKIIDYFEYEELNILNAIPTAEGAIEVAMSEMPITIHGCNAVVLGFGRVGKVLAHTLKVLGADVRVAARKHSDFAWMEVYGYKSFSIYELEKELGDCDVIFNTIPKMILNKEIINIIPENTLIIDLASKPGGVDFEAAKELGRKVMWVLSLPGKVAPVSSGKIVMSTVMNIMQEEGIL